MQKKNEQSTTLLNQRKAAFEFLLIDRSFKNVNPLNWLKKPDDLIETATLAVFCLDQLYKMTSDSNVSAIGIILTIYL